MSVQQHLDALVWAAAANSAVDAAEASEIKSHAVSLVASNDLAVPGQLRTRLDELVDLAERVVKGDPGDAGMLRALLRELILDEEPSAPEATTPEDEADENLLGLFIASSTDALLEIETSVLTLDNSEDVDACAEAVAALQRDIHTAKGECGVLSLHAAQSVWHEVETMIDEATTREKKVPVDPLMEVLDWHRAYLALLSEDGDADPPPHRSLLKSLKAWDAVELQPEASVPDDQPIVFTESLLMDETVPEFVIEARQHLEDSEAALFELEDDPASSDGIGRIFRAFHTIKGVAGFLGITEVTDLAHVVETLLDRFRSSNIVFTSGHADIVLESKDMMEQLLVGLLGGTPPLLNAHKKLVMLVGEVAKDPTKTVAFGSRAVRTALASAGIGNDSEFEEAALDPAAATMRLGAILVAKGHLTEDQLAFALERQVTLREQGETIRIGQVLVLLGAINTQQLDAALEHQSKSSALGKLLDAEVMPAPVPKPAGNERKKKASYDSTIRVSTQRLDGLVDMVGELVIAQQMVVQGTENIESGIGEVLARNLSHLGKITRDLQEASMSLRMVTFQSTFQKMHRLVRDVASKAGKSIKLEIEGADTEVDRNVVDKISDPLVHLVRNAIDHGVEPPEDRIAAGKEPQGTVVLSARHQGGAIVISLKDNGRGLDRGRILAKAKDNGLIPAHSDGSEMSDSAVYKLIFEPGFSTAAAITDISGRGVGMDVVKRNIEAMRGKVEIYSEFGKGAEFQIQLPLTLAIIDAMIVSCNSERYVIPTLSIVQSFQPDSEQLHAIKGESPVVDVRGQLVPLHRLDRILEGSSGASGHADRSTLILVEAMGRRICLVVDEIIGQQQVVIKKLGPCTPPTGVISGGAILGDGRVALIIDVEGILTESESVALC